MALMTQPSPLEHHLLESMFHQSAFADLNLAFIHPAFPITMRFDVHKAIISQSPFFSRLLANMDRIPSDLVDNTVHSQPGITTLSINLAQAMSHSGFVLAPFQHIVRRKWQKSIKVEPPTASSYPEPRNHIISSHIRFVIQWLYTFDRSELVEAIHDEDTLRILTVAILFEMNDLVQACVHRYSVRQMTMPSVMRDLEQICQLPRGHEAYHQLRDAALLLLFRHGPNHPDLLASLPVDYMADVLSADLLFVSCEFERYTLLRQVLVAFMQSVGKITWTNAGPVDQDNKRLSGFVRPIKSKQAKAPRDPESDLSGDTVRSRKRKRIPSEELDPENIAQPHPTVESPQRLSRLTFSASVPFDKLVEDTSSSGVIDKATVISYLLKTTVNYSNMTFDQLSMVRQDGIVDESVVFRALWQREALERVIMSEAPSHSHPSDENSDATRNDRNAALDEYFDVDDSDDQEHRRRLLLGIPRFRFCVSVPIDEPTGANGWTRDVNPLAAKMNELNKEEVDELESEDDDDATTMNETDLVDSRHVHDLAVGSVTDSDVAQITHHKTFFSRSESFLGNQYCVKVQATYIPTRMNNALSSQGDPDDSLLICRFELLQNQLIAETNAETDSLRTRKRSQSASAGGNKHRSGDKMSKIPVMASRSASDSQTHTCSNTVAVPISSKHKVAKTDNEPLGSIETLNQSNIQYRLYCLNRHQGYMGEDCVDPEDRAMVPVTIQCDGDDSDYIAPARIETNGESKVIAQVVVTLEANGFPI